MPGIGSILELEARKRIAWAKTRPAGLAAAFVLGGGEVRLDDFGNLIRWEAYGDANSQYGWEIDHQQPTALGGSDHHSNLRALHCKANRSLGGLLGSALNRNPFLR